jgi:drug/metabolite transporter (DMT)-like permease
LTTVFWGGTFVAGRLAGEVVHPITSATGRFLIATIALFSFIYLRERTFPQLSLRQWGGMVILGLTGVFGYNLFFFTGLQHVEAGRGAMIIAMNPVVTTLLAVFFLGERFNRVRTTGILLSILGAITVISRGDFSTVLHSGIGYGELCIFGAVLNWSAYTLVGRKLLQNISPLTAVAYSSLTGTILLLPLLYVNNLSDELFTFSLKGTGSIFYLAILGTALGFIWFYEGVQKLGAGRAVQFVNLVPVSGVIFGILLLGEKLSISLFLGGSMVMVGLMLINLRYQPRLSRK